MKPKFVGSEQFALQWWKFRVHSASLMCSDAHHCVLLQLMLSLKCRHHRPPKYTALPYGQQSAPADSVSVNQTHYQ
jgi:hypothetical protein